MASKIEFGFMYAPDQMMVMKTVDEDQTALELNLLRRELNLHFTHTLKESRGQYLAGALPEVTLLICSRRLQDPDPLLAITNGLGVWRD